MRLRLKINHGIVSKWLTLSLNILPKGEVLFRRGTGIFFLQRTNRTLFNSLLGIRATYRHERTLKTQLSTVDMTSVIYFCRVWSKLACEAQTYFRSPLLSLRKTIIIFRRERSDDRKYVCGSQARSKLKVTKVRKEEAFLIIHYLTLRK